MGEMLLFVFLPSSHSACHLLRPKVLRTEGQKLFSESDLLIVAAPAFNCGRARSAFANISVLYYWVGRSPMAGSLPRREAGGQSEFSVRNSHQLQLFAIHQKVIRGRFAAGWGGASICASDSANADRPRRDGTSVYGEQGRRIWANVRNSRESMFGWAESSMGSCLADRLQLGYLRLGVNPITGRGLHEDCHHVGVVVCRPGGNATGHKSTK